MKRLLVVVDMQRDFIDGSLGTREAVAIVPKVKRKIEEYLADGQEVVFTMDTHFEDYLDTQEGRNLPVKHCIKGTNGWRLCEELEGFEGRRFEKSAFGSVECGSYAALGGYDRVELAGLCTDICVISNAMVIKAMAPELLSNEKHRKQCPQTRTPCPCGSFRACRQCRDGSFRTLSQF